MKTARLCAIFTIEPLEPRLQFSGAADLAHTTTALPTASNGLVPATIGSKAFFPRDSISGLVDVYDANTSHWSTITLPQPIRVDTTARVGSKLIFGGADANGGGGTNLVDIYDADTGNWSVAKLPRAGRLDTSAVVGGKAIFTGDDSRGNPYIIIYDSRTGRWQSRPFAYYAPRGPAVVVGTKAIFTGFSDHVIVYDGMTGKWSTEPIAGLVLYRPVTVGTKIVFVRETTAVVYDTITGTQSTMATSQGLIPALTTVGSKVLIGGGGDGYTFPGPSQRDDTDIVDVYDAATGLWSTTNLSVSRGSVGAATVGNQALFAGGIINKVPWFAPLPPDRGPEQRFNTVDIFTDLSPSPVLSGGLTGHIGSRDSVTVINTGDADLAPGYTIQLYATTDRTLNGAILVGSRTVQSPLAAGASSPIRVRTVLPKGAPAGTYHLLAAVRDAGGNITPIAIEEETFRLRGSHPAAAKPSAARSAGVFSTTRFGGYK